MKRFLIYALIVIISYFSGVLFYKTTKYLLAIPEKSEIDLLYPWVTIFFLFFSLPIYFVIILLLRLFKVRSIIVNTLIKIVVLLVFSLFTAAMVPFMFGGFGYLGRPEFFFSEFAILLYSFFIGAALLFSICSSLAEKYLSRQT
ncbi:hypothetical protein [Paenibacillus alba]|uniref:DUF2975 domain-containing protein n=1 Tax=Paenibacillus alba TaxID=1197127 RepID=A0ABU6FWE1_9BACL|nr:hypothetical protein [Paenibacillus alba]MEC0226204.1 hypothetical protein [Paenibacillus alba]